MASFGGLRRCAKKNGDNQPRRAGGPPPMLSRIADVAVRRRKLVLIVALITFALAGAIGGGVAKQLSTGGFDNPASESGRAAKYLEDTFHQGAPAIVLVVHAAKGVDDPATVAAGKALTE